MGGRESGITALFFCAAWMPKMAAPNNPASMRKAGPRRPRLTAWSKPARTAWLRAKRQSVEIHLNDDTRETRHCLPSSRYESTPVSRMRMRPLAGVKSWPFLPVRPLTPTPWHGSSGRNRMPSRNWSPIGPSWPTPPIFSGVIYQGVHYTWDVLGEGIGFGGRGHSVLSGWPLIESRPECNLFAQGPIPGLDGVTSCPITPVPSKTWAIGLTRFRLWMTAWMTTRRINPWASPLRGRAFVLRIEPPAASRPFGRQSLTPPRRAGAARSACPA
ncbi:Uncharacterised protein [Bordetella bronchiseptica]|nr:Uncharacterised protein [Bordetella bronchiseptica]